ncbi:thioredoxin family protein [Thalassotalea castellviae]|uniref:Thioredoxin family protein n=1 Tax=Thalassotalea castellviae TaxID=3075612 RepID=A0ABU3A1P4_9GAMM|nr:thioredoxin family protein [Thalassotalea sp. W431]MDT0604103.1 thioredoxin family protein [Thalassotalea sp. W431]
MKHSFAILLTAFLIHAFAIAGESFETSDSLPAYSRIYDDQRDPFSDAKAAIELAKKTNRNVLIEIGGNWCTWCHKMDAFLEKNPDIYQKLHSEYVLLKINVSDSNENEAFMKSLPPTLGYPHMYVSTATGKMMLSKDTAELLTQGNYSREAWLSFLEKWNVGNNHRNVNQSETD